MKRKSRRLLTLILATIAIVGLLAACGTSPTSLPAQTQAPTPTLAATPAATHTPEPTPTAIAETTPDEDVEITMSPDPQNGEQTLVCAQRPTTGEQLVCVTVSDVYVEHYHNAEFRAGTLYVIRRTGDAQEAEGMWADELWKYTGPEEGVQLYTTHGLDFRAALDNRYVAVQDAQEQALIFLDPSGQRTYAAPYEEDFDARVALETWSSDSRAFWFSRQAGPSPQSFHKIDTVLWETTSYDVPHLGIAFEYDLNPDRGMIVYSDCPMFFDADSAEAFAESDQEVSLTLYNLETGSAQVLATAIARCFNPEWTGERSVEYADPEGAGRIQYTVE
jgi:hypothetical protein